MSALTEALEAYELAIALGAAAKVKQKLFEALATAHNAHVAHLIEIREAEEAMARTWGRLETALEEGFDDRCPWAVVPHGDLGTCAKPKGHDGKCSYRADSGSANR